MIPLTISPIIAARAARLLLSAKYAAVYIFL